MNAGITDVIGHESICSDKSDSFVSVASIDENHPKFINDGGNHSHTNTAVSANASSYHTNTHGGTQQQHSNHGHSYNSNQQNMIDAVTASMFNNNDILNVRNDEILNSRNPHSADTDNETAYIMNQLPPTMLSQTLELPPMPLTNTTGNNEHLQSGVGGGGLHINDNENLNDNMLGVERQGAGSVDLGSDDSNSHSSELMNRELLSPDEDDDISYEPADIEPSELDMRVELILEQVLCMCVFFFGFF